MEHSRSVSPQTLGLLIAGSCAIALGIYPPAARLAYAQGVNTSFIIVVTSLARTLCLFVGCRLAGQSLQHSTISHGEALYGGFLQAASTFGVIGSLAYLPGPVTVTILFTHTLLLLLFMAWKGEVALSFGIVLTTATAFLGVTLVVGLYDQAVSTNGVGLALALVASLSTMTRLYAFGKQVKRDHPMVVGTRIFAMASLFSLALLIFVPPVFPTNATGIFWSAMAALSLSLGTVGMFYGIRLLGSFQYSLMVKAEPVCTAVFSALLANELLQPSQYLGMAMVIVSLVTFQLITHFRRSHENVK